MNVWRVETEGRVVRFGEVSRRRLTRDGCNEPFRNRFWCPKRRWFQSEPCPFASRMECDTYRRMCGSL